MKRLPAIDCFPRGLAAEIAAFAEAGFDVVDIADRLNTTQNTIWSVASGWHLFDGVFSQRRPPKDWRSQWQGFYRLRCRYCDLWWMPAQMSMHNECMQCRGMSLRFLRYNKRERLKRAGGAAFLRQRFESAVLSGEVIRRARIAYGVSQQALATAIGLKKADQIRLWEKGEREPSPVYLLKIQLLLNISPAELLGLTEK